MANNNPTTTRRKSLTEAAIDVLQASAKQGQEPMHKGPFPSSYDGQGIKGDPLSMVTDIGGASTQDPSGGDVGHRSSAVIGQARQPQEVKTGKQHAPGEEEINYSKTSGRQLQNDVTAEVSPTMATPSGQAPISTPDTLEGWPVNNPSEYAEGEEFDGELTEEEIAAAKKARHDSIVDLLRSVSVDEDINALFGGTSLTEEFRNKAKTIFEAAVINRAVFVIEQLEEEQLQAAEEAVEEIKENLENQIDAYLDHVVENWMVENQVAIESGLKTEITEQFIGGLRNLFIENYIEIPDEQVSVVEALATEVEELKSRLNEEMNTNIGLKSQVNENLKDELLAKASTGLTAVQADRLAKLAESVEFTSEREYANKLSIIRQGFYSQVNTTVAPSVTAAGVLSESVTSPPTSVEVEVKLDPAIKAYAEAIRRTRFN